VDSVPEDSHAELKDLESKFGKVFNIHGGMAHSPVVLQSYIALQQMIADYGSFDRRTREPSHWRWETSTSAHTASRRTPPAARPPV